MGHEESGGEQLSLDTQWLQDALEQVQGDADLEGLSLLLAPGAGALEEKRQDPALCADPFSTMASSSVSAATEIQRLISLKKSVYDLLQDSESYIESLEKALQATRRAKEDLDAMDLCLQRADAAEQEDQIAGILPLQYKRVRLPLYPSIYQQVPLLAAQLEEVEQLRLQLCTFPWSSDETAKLNKAVINQCLRLSAMQFAATSSCPDDMLEVVESMTEEQLAKVSLPSERHPEEGIDWSDVADHVGGTHTGEECRSRWLMVDRPGLKQGVWTKEETSRLEGILQELISQSKDGIICDWEAVAQRLNTGRLGIDCLMQSQQEDLVPIYAASSARHWSKVPMSDKEKEVAATLRSIWTDDALIATRLGTGRPADQIVAKVRKGRMSKAKKPGKKYTWSEAADHALVVHIARECKLKRSHLFAHLDSHSPINFEKKYLRRPARVSARDIEDRWEHIKAEYRAGNKSIAHHKRQKRSSPSER
jgi:hypothetical protein